MDKQNSEIKFKCTTEEHDKIKQKARDCGMSIKGFILYLVKSSRIKIEIN